MPKRHSIADLPSAVRRASRIPTPPSAPPPPPPSAPRGAVRLYFYSQDWGDECNLGDYLTVLVMGALGIPVAPAVPGEPALFGIGTVAGTDHWAGSGASRIVVWGSGARPDFVGPSPVPVGFRVVRGPMTRDAYKLPDSTPTGFPTLLLPDLLPILPPSPAPGETLFVNHCGNANATPPGFDASVTMRCRRDAALDLIGRIAGAAFVGSESLHGCVIAHAFGVPWCFCTPRPWPTTKPWSKYDEWFAFLGIPGPADPLPASPGAAKAWWDRTGRLGRAPDVRHLLDAFPRTL